MDKNAKQFEVRAYNPQDLDEVVDLLTESYSLSNPFYKIMQLQKQEMKIDFRNQLLENTYNGSVIIVHKETKEIAACTFSTPLNISQIPTKRSVNKYIRDAAFAKILLIKEIDLGLNIKQNYQDRTSYGTNFAVKEKYSSQGLGNFLLKEMFKSQFGVGLYLNEQIKHMVKKTLVYEQFDSVDLDKVRIVDNNEQPFKDHGLKYDPFLFVIEDCFQHLEQQRKQQQITLLKSSLRAPKL